VTANSRMIFAFSRDGAMPFSNFWHHVSKRSHVPVHSAWFGAVGAFLLSLPYLKSYAAYGAVTSIAVIGLYVAYLIPVFLRRINGSAFHPGPWKLGKWGPVFGWIAIVWVIFICIVLLLPQFKPITANSFNYAPVAVAVVLGFAGIWYAVSARKWFKGPKIQGTAEELAAIEHELSI
jgi:amino acid transporter